MMDNLSRHKAAAVRETIEVIGADLWYLPPYSSDFNPIEKLSSKVKAWLRGVCVMTFATLLNTFADAFRDDTSNEC